MMRSKKLLLPVVGIVVVTLASMLYLVYGSDKQDTSSGVSNQSAPKVARQQPEETAKESGKVLSSFDKKHFSNDDPASLWAVVNKRRPLNPLDYVPALTAPSMQLRLAASQPEMQVSTAARADLEQLSNAAKQAGLPMMLASAYRSYKTQAAVYNREVGTHGQAEADRQSARPGHSEHQTGLAVDLAPASGKCLIAACFGALPEGKWLTAHAHEYGFIIRYQQDKEPVTGYLYEPWHLRYVGRDLAAEINRLGSPPLETFFGLPAAPDYAK